MSDDENRPGPKTSKPSKQNLSAGLEAGLGDPPSLPPYLRLAQEQLDDAMGPSREILLQLLKASEGQLAHERERRKAAEETLRELARAARTEAPEELDGHKNPYSSLHDLAEKIGRIADHYLDGGPGERHQTAKLLRQLPLGLSEPLDLKNSRQDLEDLQDVLVVHEWSELVKACFELAAQLDDTKLPTDEFAKRLEQLNMLAITAPTQVDRWLGWIVEEARRSEL